MTELTIDQELRLIELEVARLTFLFMSYPDYEGSNREHYVAVAHTETARMLEAFKKKWNIS